MGKPALISHVREPQNSLWVKDTSVEKFIVGCFSSLVLFCVPSNCFIVCVCSWSRCSWKDHDTIQT